MYYAICYDIENDKLREKTAKALARHGCKRVQRSVFIAPAISARQLERLRDDLKQLLACRLTARDSLLFLPLRSEKGTDIYVLGNNNINTFFEDKPLKIII
ncbi:MAG: CRISPR-associated endonuclease Cas2 [Saprospiraceae bacterium]|nr:CRISPR-associated endonuclease Cas2 [Saprospiraceae bacterium]